MYGFTGVFYVLFMTTREKTRFVPRTLTTGYCYTPEHYTDQCGECNII